MTDWLSFTAMNDVVAVALIVTLLVLEILFASLTRQLADQAASSEKRLCYRDRAPVCFHTWGNSWHRAIPTPEESALQEPTSPPMGFAFMEDRNGILCWTGRFAEADSGLHC
jgi:hypothetical protein